MQVPGKSAPTKIPHLGQMEIPFFTLSEPVTLYVSHA